ncbi:hypothetical protein PT974_09565 [Cladobotryum mycophilum]|uniref:Uncharacterized protein n=1 Tax=Cladobotryum mycophilum TaxID=491253 RepID=A0ABR0SGM5_9HYPO
MSRDTKKPKVKSSQNNRGSVVPENGTSAMPMHRGVTVQEGNPVMLIRWFEETPENEPFHGLELEDLSALTKHGVAN